MQKSRLYPWTLLLILLASIPAWAAVGSMDAEVQHLQRRWAEVNYQLQGDTQLTAFQILTETAERVTRQYPEAAPGWIWSGIIKSTYAGAKGGLGALKFAKEAKADLEKALQIDPLALQGSAYTSLGTLYFNVPGWPIGFGDDKKAEKLLLKALSINPDGIDSNYFYADYLRGQKRYKKAKKYLLKAQAAAPRPARPLADEGRQKEIAQALLALEKKLSS